MSDDFLNKQWGCGNSHAVKLQKVDSMVCDVGIPCLDLSPIKVNKMLKPDKWQAIFDSDGRVIGFHKALKLIVMGGVDPSIRPEVWEFLLGCYALSSTTEYRKMLRTARRERYEELVKQCKRMHSSIGTGSLAYVVGSKIMDVRTYPRDDGQGATDTDGRQTSENNTNKHNDYCDRSDNCTDTAHSSSQRESSSDSSDIGSLRGSNDSVTYDSDCPPNPASSSVERRQSNACQYHIDNIFDFPALPVRDLFDRRNEDEQGRFSRHERRPTQWKLQLDSANMHSFPTKDNKELVIESNGSQGEGIRNSVNAEIEIDDGFCRKSYEVSRPDILKYKKKVLNRLRISDVPETSNLYSSNQGDGPSEDKVSDWLWTLHRIVVDVVRTDSNMEFYEDPKNLARMSDILAVYAWADPETGYCQGMSDLLSPFVVLFENDADAFWCFEMLLRRTRENFRMEGQTGVFKQLQTLWHILQVTEREMFSHLSHIGAESLHFAFRMLLVLFRRELSFDEALCMWEMMWAADFDEPIAQSLAENCLEPLVVQLPNELDSDVGEERRETDECSSKSGPLSKSGSLTISGLLTKGSPLTKSSPITKSGSLEHASDETLKALASNNSFCGLTKTLWSRNDHTHSRSGTLVSRNKEDELPVFCVAAILILNRHKLIKESESIDDLIKIFNDNLLKFKVRRCIRTAVKLRKKYFYKLAKHNNPSLD